MYGLIEVIWIVCGCFASIKWLIKQKRKCYDMEVQSVCCSREVLQFPKSSAISSSFGTIISTWERSSSESELHAEGFRMVFAPCSCAILHASKTVSKGISD